MEVEQQELAEPLERRCKGSSIAPAVAEYIKTKHEEEEDMPAIEDKEKDVEGEQELFNSSVSAQTDSKEDQSRTIRTIAEKERGTNTSRTCGRGGPGLGGCPRHQEWWTWKNRESQISTSAGCKENEQEMLGLETTSRSGTQHRKRRRRQVDKRGICDAVKATVQELESC